MATPPGFEPGLNGPKPLVLPLHHGVAAGYIKYHRARRIAKIFGGENPFFTVRRSRAADYPQKSGALRLIFTPRMVIFP